MISRIQKARSWLPPSSPAQTITSPHNLDELFQEINNIYFSNTLTLKTHWYGTGKTQAKTTIRLGYYDPIRCRIGINRLLNNPEIPKYYLSYIIYHEILHYITPPLQKVFKKRKIHHKEFLEKEKQFIDYDKAQQFLLLFKKTYLPRRN